MKFEVQFEGTPNPIPFASINKFVFTTDMTSLYSTCHIVATDLLHKLFNSIKIGSAVKIIFIEDDKEYINDMAVFSFNKIPRAYNKSSDYIDIQLISSLYFKDPAPRTMVHSANVGNIITDILANKLIVAPQYKDISPTTDVAAIRYQIGKRYQEFMLDIVKYASIDELPVYLFTDHRGILHLKGIAEAWKASNYSGNATPAPFLIVDTMSESSNNPPPSVSDTKLYAKAYKVIGDASTATNNVKCQLLKKTFLDPYNTKTLITFNTSEPYNNQSARVSPGSYIYSGWETPPEDAKNSSKRDALDKNLDTFTMDVIVNDFVGQDLDIMSNVRVVLPFPSDELTVQGVPSTAGDGLYLVKSMQYILESPKNIRQTRLSLLQISC